MHIISIDRLICKYIIIINFIDNNIDDKINEFKEKGIGYIRIGELQNIANINSVSSVKNISVSIEWNSKSKELYHTIILNGIDISDCVNNAFVEGIFNSNSELQNVYNDNISDMQDAELKLCICPKCGKHYINCGRFGDLFKNHSKYHRGVVFTSKINIVDFDNTVTEVLVDTTFQLNQQRVICPNENCNATHALISDALIPYIRITLNDAIEIAEFEISYQENKEYKIQRDIHDRYNQYFCREIEKYTTDAYRIALGFFVGVLPAKLLAALFENNSVFIRDFYNKCKRLFFVNREVVIIKDTLSVKTSHMKVSAFYFGTDDIIFKQKVPF